MESLSCVEVLGIAPQKVPMIKLRSKLASTFLLPSIVIVHVPFPLQSLPLHSSKTEISLGAAVTTVFLGNVAWHPPPQSMPMGRLVTLPSPRPDLLTG